MKRWQPRFGLRAALLVVALAAMVFAVAAARPAAEIRIHVHADGSIDCESMSCRSNSLKSILNDEVQTRKWWYVEPRAVVVFEPDVPFEQVPEILSLAVEAGCEKVQLGLPPKLAADLSHPELTSEPW